MSIVIFNRMLLAGALPLFGVIFGSLIAHAEDLESVTVLNNNSVIEDFIFGSALWNSTFRGGCCYHDSDPQSVAVANYFQVKHRIPAETWRMSGSFLVSRSMPGGYFFDFEVSS